MFEILRFHIKLVTIHVVLPTRLFACDPHVCIPLGQLIVCCSPLDVAIVSPGQIITEAKCTSFMRILLYDI